ncbi:MAG: ABC transporter permease, partial [Thermoleophilia bacterium]|nr:ABC transporter permease [Thermoleophilia bacterium]
RPAAAAGRRPSLVLLAATWRQGRTKLGLAIVALLVGIALFGPLFAPYGPDEGLTRPGGFVAPFEPPSEVAPLGTDNLGRDVLSRFLCGGRSVLALSALATVLGAVLGIAVGLLAAYSRGLLDEVLMRAQDVVFAFPQLVFALVLVATVGPQLWLLVLAVGITTMPRVARVTRGAAVEVVERDFVRAAEGIGVPRRKILLGEILPNVTSPLVVEVTLRLTFNIAVIAALSFLGFGLQPPAADWGLMINENRQGLLADQPWGVVLPVAAIGLLTIGTSLVGDGFARAAIGIERGRTRE